MSSSAAATSGSSTSTTITGGVTTTSSTALSTPTGPTQPATVNGIWTWYGCRTEATNMRALSLATFAADTMTLEACGTFCAAGSYTYFGTEYARECYCGNSFNPGSVPAPATDCSFECMGNSLEYCGAGQRLSVYTMNGVSQSPSLSGSSTSSTSSISASPSPTGPQTVTTLAGWNYLGCYTEATTGRALNGILLPIPAAVTDVETCAAACSAYTYFGVEYGQECYCGDFLNAGSVNSITVPNSNPCNIVCANNANEYCGGRSVLNLYQVAISSSSTLSSTSSSTTSSSVSSVSSSSSSSTASPSSSTTVSSSSTTSTVSSSSSSSSTSSFSTASSSPLPYTDMTANGFAFLGCAPEDTHATDGPGRTLSGTLYADDAMTDGKCMAFCLSHGYAFAGTEYTRECWCGNSVAPGREPQTTIASLAGCNFPCGGDSTQYCGGSGWLSLYQACTVGSACVNAQFT
jgi:hypothetical protein